MSSLKLSFGAGDYELTRPLKEGFIRADGIDLNVLTSDARERHWRMARYGEYDICEFNVYTYLIARDQGVPLQAIPVFLHRRFRHGFIFVRPGSGITRPQDLVGKRIGTTNFQPAACMWMRGWLEEDYGVPHRSVTWVTERDEDLDFEIPDGLKIERIRKDQDLEKMLMEGELDALITPEVPKAFNAGDPRIVRIFDDHKAVEIDYYKRTGIFPIMHITVIRQEILDRDPWVAASLLKAFTEAKAYAYKRVSNPRVVPLVWWVAALEEQRKLLGPDPWQFGLGEANQKNLETIQRFALNQGVIKKKLPLADLFAYSDISGLREGK